jgi:hypothetical protein
MQKTAQGLGIDRRLSLLEQMQFVSRDDKLGKTAIQTD